MNRIHSMHSSQEFGLMSQSDRRQTVTRLNCTVLSYFIDSRLFTSYSAFTEFPGSRNRVALTAAADQMILPKRKRIIRENNKSEPIPIRPVKSSVILLSIIGDSNIPVNLISMDLPCLGHAENVYSICSIHSPFLKYSSSSCC